MDPVEVISEFDRRKLPHFDEHRMFEMMEGLNASLEMDDT